MNIAYALRKDFDSATVATTEGETVDVVKLLEKTNPIVTDDEVFQRSLDSVAALERVPLPKDAEQNEPAANEKMSRDELIDLARARGIHAVGVNDLAGAINRFDSGEPEPKDEPAKGRRRRTAKAEEDK